MVRERSALISNFNKIKYCIKNIIFDEGILKVYLKNIFNRYCKKQVE